MIFFSKMPNLTTKKCKTVGIYLRFLMSFPCDRKPLCVAEVCRKTYAEKINKMKLVSESVQSVTNLYSSL